MTVDGYLAVEVVEGSVDSFLFYEFIIEKVVSGQKLHNGIQTYIFIVIASIHEPIPRPL